MITQRPARIALWIAAAVGLVAIQVFVPGPSGSIFWSAVFDAGHVPLYGLVALALLQWLRASARGTDQPRIRHYAHALALTAAAGGLAEIFQTFGPGDAAFSDFARDVLGGGVALLLALGFDRRVDGRTTAVTGRNRARRPLLFVSAVVLLAVALFPVTRVAFAHLQRDAAFPSICDFESAWETTFVAVEDAQLDRTAPPQGWDRPGSRHVGRVTFLPAEYPRLSIQEPCPDWTGYSRLSFEVFSESTAPLELVFRIHDIHHDNEFGDRFNRVLVIRPGANRISIPLAEVRSAPRGRPMDMTHIRNITLFAVRPSEAFAVYVDGIELEGP